MKYKQSLWLLMLPCLLLILTGCSSVTIDSINKALIIDNYTTVYATQTEVKTANSDLSERGINVNIQRMLNATSGNKQCTVYQCATKADAKVFYESYSSVAGYTIINGKLVIWSNQLSVVNKFKE